MTPEKKEKISYLRAELGKLSPTQQQELAAKIGIVTIDGHVLSVFNQCFLYFQSRNNEQPPTIVGGFRQWLKVGRSVKKGEHGMIIWVPSSKKGEDGVIEDVLFFTATVFDISQTKEIED
jgi:hypothetical protein